MEKSKLSLLKKVEAQLFAVPDLVTGFQTKEPGIVTRFTNWLTDAEKMLKENNLSICSEMSGLRSKLLHAGMSNPTTKRKQQFATSLEIIPSAQSILQDVITPINAKVEQSRQVLQQTITLAYNTGLIRDKQEMEFNTWVGISWAAIKRHDQLSAGIVNAVSLVCFSDAYILFAEKLTDYFNEMNTSKIQAAISA